MFIPLYIESSPPVIGVWDINKCHTNEELAVLARC